MYANGMYMLGGKTDFRKSVHYMGNDEKSRGEGVSSVCY